MYKLIRKLLFKLDAERAHNFSMNAFNTINNVAEPLVKEIFKPSTNIDSEVEALGQIFKNPVGLAAGFDKNAKYAKSLQNLGFGFLEVGSVTYDKYHGNKKPRLFRIPEDNAIVNRMGLNNNGAIDLFWYLHKNHWEIEVPLFVNIAATPKKYVHIEQICHDYVKSINYLDDVANVLVLNVSCPNCEDGTTFAEPDNLFELLNYIRINCGSNIKPLIVKIPFGINLYKLYDILDILEQFNVSGITHSNTNSNHHYNIKGGYSGPNLKQDNLYIINEIKNRSNLTVIGCGGIQSPQDAQDYLNVGADLIQVGTGLVYQGPFLIKKIIENIKI